MLGIHRKCDIGPFLNDGCFFWKDSCDDLHGIREIMTDLRDDQKIRKSPQLTSRSRAADEQQR